MTAPSNQAQITAYLAGKGMPAAGIAGVEGNLSVESHMNPTAYNPAENAHGYAQWEGGRWSGPNGLLPFAQARGTQPTDSQTQLDFMWSELVSPAYSGVLNSLMTATDPVAAATSFDQGYERSSAASLPTRQAAAASIFGGGVAGGSRQLSTGGSTAGGSVQNSGLISGIWDGFLSAMQPLGRLVVDAGLVVMGLVMVIAAAVIIARSGDSSSPPAPAAAGDDRKAGGAEAAGEDAAELAAA